MPLILVLLAAAARLVMAAGARPSEVAVGELFTYDSVIGRASRLVVDDVNTNHKTCSVLVSTWTEFRFHHNFDWLDVLQSVC